MGVLKLALIVVLLVSFSGQENPIVNEDEKIVSKNALDNALDNAQDVVEEAPVIALDRELPITILTTNKPVIVTSEKSHGWRREDSLFDRKPTDTEAVKLGTADGPLNRSQWLQRSETSTRVTNKYGNQEQWFRMLGVWSLASVTMLVIVIVLVYIGRGILKRRKKKENQNAKEVEVKEFIVDESTPNYLDEETVVFISSLNFKF